MDLAFPSHDSRTEVSRLYHAVLQKYLRQGLSSDLEPARELGRHAVALGLETLDMARIHEIALVALVLPSYSPHTSSTLMGRAGLFFAEAITPIENNHRGAREANARLSQVVKTLAKTVEELKGEIALRSAVETALRDSQQEALRLVDHSRAMEESLRHLSRQLLTAQEEERRRISRELHDVIAQTLSSINLRLATLGFGSSSNAAQLAAAIADTRRQVEISVDLVHRFARELRPTMLDDLGLIPALRTHVKRYTEQTGIQVGLTTFADVEMEEASVRTMLYRVAQEALTNVARHANATQVTVHIRAADGGICMEITDNGQGFAVEGNTSVKKHNRLGLLGMKERVEMTGGIFAILSAPGRPTTIRVTVPAAQSPPRPASSSHNVETFPAP
jgi:signal transduction histidine kinase